MIIIIIMDGWFGFSFKRTVTRVCAVCEQAKGE